MNFTESMARVIKANDDIVNMSFESCYYSGGMIGGYKKVSPIIFCRDGRTITDIIVGENRITTWANSESTFEKGETIAECMIRHGIEKADVKKIVVSIEDTTGDEDVHEVVTWTPENGWTEETEN